MRCVIAEAYQEFLGLAFVRLGDRNEIQMLIKICGGLSRFTGVEGEDRVDCDICDPGAIGIARIEPLPVRLCPPAWRLARCLATRQG